MQKPDESLAVTVSELEPGLPNDRALQLVDLARKHRLRWEVWPERRVFDGLIKQIGFEVDLLGEHDHPRHPVYAGCDECAAVARALALIADYVLPKGPRASRYEVERHLGALRFPKNAWESGNVTLTIRILHRKGFEAPPDDCEIECLEEMEAKLRALGARASGRHLGEVRRA